jgi:hypothetical protein
MIFHQRLRQLPPACQWSPDYQAKAYHEKKNRTPRKREPSERIKQPEQHPFVANHKIYGSDEQETVRNHS